ncbi:hypothetical protein CTAYLR_007919 [Chrysophaeum taylorii]|uniref:Translocon-associated protein subunit beta n=1 Tax=Chrysophaeum taylorii TaxID=2483200 RepID=A0AAD7XJE7_9STRA|nr:hypothetical protein CTAYLR_007919 [Chrysophaeum taylorii]
MWLFLFAVAVVAEENQTTTTTLPSLVLARKHIPRGSIVVEGKPLTLTYEVCNVGAEPATEVVVADVIDPSVFEVIAGGANARIAELGPGGRSSYNVTVVPLVSGSVEVARAVVRYVIGGQSKRMVSSSPGRLEITSAGAYLRATSYYLKEWFVFMVFTAVPIVLPAIYYYTQKASSSSSSSSSS